MAAKLTVIDVAIFRHSPLEFTVEVRNFPRHPPMFALLATRLVNTVMIHETRALGTSDHGLSAKAPHGRSELPCRTTLRVRRKPPTVNWAKKLWPSPASRIGYHC